MFRSVEITRSAVSIFRKIEEEPFVRFRAAVIVEIFLVFVIVKITIERLAREVESKNCVWSDIFKRRPSRVSFIDRNNRSISQTGTVFDHRLSTFFQRKMLQYRKCRRYNRFQSVFLKSKFLCNNFCISNQ